MTVDGNRDESEGHAMSPLGETEVWVSRVLRAGVLLSLVLIGAGVVVTFVRTPELRTSHSVFDELIRAHRTTEFTLWTLIADLADGRPDALIRLGLATLIATPVFRVGAAFILYVRQRDRLFSVLTAIVLAFLALSAWLGGIVEV